MEMDALGKSGLTVSAMGLGFPQRIEEIARDKNCRPVQLALAWVLAQGKDVVLIPRSKRPT